MKELVCIVCPKGCRLQVDEEHGYAVTGNSCARGAAYGREELQHPTRMLTTTVKLAGGAYECLPVRTRNAIPKELLFEAMRALDAVCVHSPVHVGDVVLPDLLGTGVDVIATREL